MAEIPIARALVVCENIIIDARRESVSAINCFFRLGVDRFPSDPQRFFVYVALTNGSGKCSMNLEIASLELDEIVYSRAFSLDFSNPLKEVPFSFRVRSCRFPRPGKYNIRLVANNEIIAETVFRVVLEESGS